jgi:hypothetical protein
MTVELTQGSEEFLAAYSTRLRIGVDKVWTTPTGG